MGKLTMISLCIKNSLRFYNVIRTAIAITLENFLNNFSVSGQFIHNQFQLRFSLNARQSNALNTIVGGSSFRRGALHGTKTIAIKDSYGVVVFIYYKIRQKIFEEGKRVKSAKGKNPEQKTRDENRHCCGRGRSSRGTQSGNSEGRSAKHRHAVHEFYRLS